MWVWRWNTVDEVEPILTKQRTRKPTLGPILINLDIMKQGTKVLGCNRAKRCPRSQDNQEKNAKMDQNILLRDIEKWMGC